jgi:hypothetical protein
VNEPAAEAFGPSPKASEPRQKPADASAKPSAPAAVMVCSGEASLERGRAPLALRSARGDFERRAARSRKEMPRRVCAFVAVALLVGCGRAQGIEAERLIPPPASADARETPAARGLAPAVPLAEPSAKWLGPLAVLDETNLGTIDDWIAAWPVAAERRTPPELEPLAVLRQLPRARLALVRAGRVVLVALPSGAETLLTPDDDGYDHPRWTADGRYLFATRTKGHAIEVVRLDPDRASTKVVTKSRPKEDLTWSIDAAGDRVVLGDWLSGENDLLVEVSDGTERALGSAGREPLLSRDGSKVWSVTGEFEHEAVSALDLETGNATDLTPAGGIYHRLREIGGDLLVSRQTSSWVGNPIEPFVLPRQGGSPRPLGALGWPSDAPPDLVPECVNVVLEPTPDRRRVAVLVEARFGGGAGVYHTRLGVTGWAGSKLRLLDSPFPHPFFAPVVATWAPDGRHLAFQLRFCSSDCESKFNRVVIIDTSSAALRYALVGPGTSPAFAPSGS